LKVAEVDLCYMQADVHNPLHAEGIEKVRQLLIDHGWHVCEEFTYHAALPDHDSKQIARSSGRWSSLIRGLPDLFAISPDSEMIGFEIKAVSGENLAVEASPLINFIQKKFPTVYVTWDGSNLTGFRTTHDDYPSPTVLFVKDVVFDADLIKSAKRLWPHITIRTRSQFTGGSGDNFVLIPRSELLPIGTLFKEGE